MKLSWRPRGREWTTYYEESESYPAEALEHKEQIITEFLDEIKPRILWDLGANTGLFSHIASDMGIQTISFDMDPACVEENYLTVVHKHKKNILPLVFDLTNPSPKIGWENKERMSIFERGPADTVLALALIHHLAISNNLPLDWLASFFRRICSRSLIIEFVPKSDPKVQRLLSTREDIFPYYTEDALERTFGKLFTIKTSVKVRDSKRTLYWMEGG